MYSVLCATAYQLYLLWLWTILGVPSVKMLSLDTQLHRCVLLIQAARYQVSLIAVYMSNRYHYTVCLLASLMKFACSVTKHLV